MFSYIWPIALVILSNVVYHICAKSVPENASPFTSLAITYLIGAIVSVLMFFITEPKQSLVGEFVKANWSSYVLGFVIVRLEVGFIYAYKAGWQVSTASIVQGSFLAIALITVGLLLYHKTMTWNKLEGIGIYLVGLVFINLK